MATVRRMWKGKLVRPIGECGTLTDTRARCLKEMPGLTVYDDPVREKLWESVRLWEADDDRRYLKAASGAFFLKGSYVSADKDTFPVRYTVCNEAYEIIADIRIRPTLESRVKKIAGLPMGLPTLTYGVPEKEALKYLAQLIQFAADNNRVVFLYGGSPELMMLGLTKANVNVLGELRNMKVIRYLQSKGISKTSLDVVYDSYASAGKLDRVCEPPFPTQTFLDCNDAASHLRCKMAAYIWNCLKKTCGTESPYLQADPQIRLQLMIQYRPAGTPFTGPPMGISEFKAGLNSVTRSKEIGDVHKQKHKPYNKPAAAKPGSIDPLDADTFIPGAKPANIPSVPKFGEARPLQLSATPSLGEFLTSQPDPKMDPERKSKATPMEEEPVTVSLVAPKYNLRPVRSSAASTEECVKPKQGKETRYFGVPMETKPPVITKVVPAQTPTGQ